MGLAMRRQFPTIVTALIMHAGLAAARAEEQPMLQLDTGGHQGTINGVAFSPDAVSTIRTLPFQVRSDLCALPGKSRIIF
jgi:hypothetical protein